jgi:hypothetical protein
MVGLAYGRRQRFGRAASALVVSGLLLTALSGALIVTSPGTGDAATASKTFKAPAAGANASVTISKTSGLHNETVEVSWKGFKPSSSTQLNNAGSAYDTETANPVRVYQCRGDDRDGDMSSSDCYGSGGFRGIPSSNGNPAVPAVPGFTYPGQTDEYANTPDGPSNFQDTVTAGDGTGSVTVQLFTRLEATSLGCDEDTPCSIVVVPNYGRENGASATEDQLDAPWAWERRTVIPLNFAPIEATCPSSSDSLPIQGSPMSARLIASWRAGSCIDKQAQVALDYTMVGEIQARSDVASGLADLGLSTQLLPNGTEAPVVQAPVSVSGISVAFQIDDANGQAVHSMRLNARLVAKLITASYRMADDSNVENNPSNLFHDPEFLALNPGVNWPSGSPGNHVLLLGDISDTTYALTTWIASDPEASVFMNGKPDPYGMTVNRAYKGIHLPFSTFPLLDKWQSDNFEPIQGMDHLARQLSLSQFPGAIVTYEDGLPVISKPSRQNPGRREVIGIVDSADAESFLLDTARLENSGGEFVGPTNAGMAAGVHSMRSGATLVDQSDKDKAIYPLTMVVSAIARLDAAKDTRYAAARFLDFARTRGQQPGSGVGDLPTGHLPLPASLRAETAAAAAALRKGVDAEDGPGGDGGDPSDPNGGTTTDNGGILDTTEGSMSGSDPADAADRADLASAIPAAYSSAQPWTSSVIVPIALGLGLLALVLGGATSWLVRTGRGPAWLRR